MEGNQHSPTVAPKGAVNTITTLNDGSKPLQSRSDSSSEKISCMRCSKRCLERQHSKRINWRRKMTFILVQFLKGEVGHLLRNIHRGGWENGAKRHIQCRRAWDFGTDNELSVEIHKKSELSCDREVPVIRPVNDLFWGALYYRTYNLGDKWSHYENEIARSFAKWDTRLQVQMWSQVLDSIALVSVLSFFSAFKLARDRNGGHDGATLWLIYNFMTRPAAAVLNTLITFQ